MADKLFDKIQNKQIPNVYFLLIGIAFCAVVGVVYLAIYGMQRNVVLNEDRQLGGTTPKHFNFSRLDYGMSRRDVIHALGKPDWAALSGDEGSLAPPASDIGLELRWSNPSCRDVVVMFDKSREHVIGWDTGDKYCGTMVESSRDAFLCTQPDRAKYCTY